MNRPEHAVWPLISDAAAPWDPLWPEDDLGFEDHRVCPIVDTLDEATYRRAALALQHHLDALARGATYESGRLDALARAAAVPLRSTPDRRPVHVAPHLVDEESVVRLALDLVPDAGQRGADEILGPRRLALCAIADRRSFVYAVAQWAVSGPDRSPIEGWTRSRVAPKAPGRAAVRAIWQAPLGLWTLRASTAGWRLRDRLGLDPRRVPDVPVTLTHDQPVADGDTLLGRAVPFEDGTWRVFAGLRVAGPPTDARIAAVAHIGLVRARLRRRRSSHEDLLRHDARWWARQWMSEAFLSTSARLESP